MNFATFNHNFLIINLTIVTLFGSLIGMTSPKKVCIQAIPSTASYNIATTKTFTHEPLTEEHYQLLCDDLEKLTTKINRSLQDKDQRCLRLLLFAQRLSCRQSGIQSGNEVYLFMQGSPHIEQFYKTYEFGKTEQSFYRHHVAKIQDHGLKERDDNSSERIQLLLWHEHAFLHATLMFLQRDERARALLDRAKELSEEKPPSPLKNLIDPRRLPIRIKNLRDSDGRPTNASM